MICTEWNTYIKCPVNHMIKTDIRVMVVLVDRKYGRIMENVA